MRGRGDETGQQVEELVRERPEDVLDVVAEDPEEQHVAADVQQAPVQEHRVDDREIHALLRVRRGLLRVGVAAGLDIGGVERPVVQDLARHRGVLVGELGLADVGRARVGGAPPLRLDEEVDEHVRGNEEERDVRDAPGRVVVLERDHAGAEARPLTGCELLQALKAAG